NKGLTNSGSSYLIGLFGRPAENMNNQNCVPMTNPLLRDLVKTEDVGPIRVTMLEPAILSLRQVFRNVKIFEPELYKRIKTAGSLCVRLIRGSTTSVSTHAYGLSVDLNIDGVTDTLGDGKTQLGLVILADFFNKEGWYWGASFGREDSMHFQVSREKIDQWLRQGLISTK
ncbi:MAG: M15 family metallopeptidase, partial [Pseudomonadota bacterium]